MLKEQNRQNKEIDKMTMIEEYFSVKCYYSPNLVDGKNTKFNKMD